MTNRLTSNEQIARLTMADVNAAKKQVIANRATRSGSSTIDYILSQVGGSKTLEQAKVHLVLILKKQTG